LTAYSCICWLFHRIQDLCYTYSCGSGHYCTYRFGGLHSL